MSLQGLELQDVETFWADFSSRLLLYNDDQIHAGQVPPIKSAKDFSLLFTKPELFKEKKRVVLFVDEFDFLLYGKEEMRASFINILREMKQKHDVYFLHSIIGIGPFKIINATKASTISPFNVSESILTPTFTSEETKDLFREYCNEYGYQIADSVIEDIFMRTGGHAGQTSLCGKMIHEILLKQRKTLKLEDWLIFTVQCLPQMAASRWHTLTHVYNKNWK